MSAKNSALWISLLGIALFAGLSVTRAQTMAQTDIVTAISNLENDAVKADLAKPASANRSANWGRPTSLVVPIPCAIAIAGNFTSSVAE